MYLGKKLISLLLSLLFIFTIISITQAKSVYVISDTQVPDETSEIQTYKIDGNDLSYQETYISDIWGAVGLTIDIDKEFLFVTFEYEDKIELVNAKTMQHVDTVIAPGAPDLAGIVFDNERQKVYTVERGRKYLNRIENYNIILL